MKVNLIGERAINKKVAPMPQVQDAVEDAADGIKTRAELRLAAHRKTGDHHIEMEKNVSAKYGYLDYEVSLVGSAPWSVEFGHDVVNEHGPTGEYAPGLYIITGAAGLA